MNVPPNIPLSQSLESLFGSKRLLTLSEISQLRKSVTLPHTSRLQRLINGIPHREGKGDDTWAPICRKAKESVIGFWNMSDVVQYEGTTDLIFPNPKTFEVIYQCLDWTQS